MPRSKELITAELANAQAQVTLREQAKQIASMQHMLATNELPELYARAQALQAELEALPKE